MQSNPSVYVPAEDPDHYLSMEELFGSPEVTSIEDIEDLEDEDLSEITAEHVQHKQ